MRNLRTWVAAAAVLAFSGAAYAAPVFQGRLADGTASATCTSNGAGGTTKCAMFYNTTLDITILNDWNIGTGFWSATADPGSAQALAESAGSAQTAFTGWSLPTGNGFAAAGALNQYLSIWSDVGGTLAGLQAQFDGVQRPAYWAATEISAAGSSWIFYPADGNQEGGFTNAALFAVAVRSGDVTAAVPEPHTLTLMLLGLGATVLARRRRSR